MIAGQNVSGAAPVRSVRALGCGTADAGTVRVAYSAPQSLFFAPVLGLGNSRKVVASANAIWGPAGTGPSPPLQVSADEDGNVACMTNPNECSFWYDNQSTNDAPGSFGMLSILEGIGWPTSGDGSGGSCGGAGGASNVRDWLTTSKTDSITNIRNIIAVPSYVCAIPGNLGTGEEHSQAFLALQELEGQTLFFPVSQPDQAAGGRFAIIGFIPLTVCRADIAGCNGDAGVYEGNHVKAVGSATTTSGVCHTPLPLPRFTSQSRTYTLPSTFWTNCAPPGATLTPSPPSAPSIQLYVNGQPFSTNKYSWNTGNSSTPANTVITFNANAFTGQGAPSAIDADFFYSWSLTTPRTGGYCHGHDPDNNAFCLHTVFAGTDVLGTNPLLTGKFFGAGAIRLSR